MSRGGVFPDFPEQAWRRIARPTARAISILRDLRLRYFIALILFARRPIVARFFTEWYHKTHAYLNILVRKRSLLL